jgi:cell division protein DivIC
MNLIKRIFGGNYRFYSISTIVLFVWMFFLDTNDLSVQYRLSDELSNIKSEKAYYQKKLKELDKERRLVIGNPALLEKYAREKYLMKKPKEDIFVIVDENNQPIER